MKIFMCRCEDVTLLEVTKAVDLGHSDLESIKRYTGLGTGWCQGRQCLASCARWLEGKKGVEPQAPPITPRPPLHPVPIAWLAQLAEENKD